VGEHREGLTASRQGRGTAGAALRLWLGPETNPAGTVYGTITIGGVLAAEGSRGLTLPRTIIAALLILVLYWFVHAWSDDTGNRIEQGRPFSVGEFGTELGRNWTIVRGSTVPLIAVVIAALAGAPDQRAIWAGTLVAAASLVAIELVTALRMRLGAAQILLQTAVGAGFGIALIAMRYVLHP